jgi:hypothetical protein
MEVPVLVLDLDDREAAKLLAVYDPLAGMAEANEEMLAELLGEVETDSEALESLLDEMLAQSSPEQAEEAAGSATPAEVKVDDCFQVVIECADEEQQQAIYERMSGEGLKCRLLTL